MKLASLLCVALFCACTHATDQAIFIEFWRSSRAPTLCAPSNFAMPDGAFELVYPYVDIFSRLYSIPALGKAYYDRFGLLGRTRNFAGHAEIISSLQCWRSMENRFEVAVDKHICLTLVECVLECDASFLANDMRAQLLEFLFLACPEPLYFIDNIDLGRIHPWCSRERMLLHPKLNVSAFGSLLERYRLLGILEEVDPDMLIAILATRIDGNHPFSFSIPEPQSTHLTDWILHWYGPSIASKLCRSILFDVKPKSLRGFCFLAWLNRSVCPPCFQNIIRTRHKIWSLRVEPSSSLDKALIRLWEGASADDQNASLVEVLRTMHTLFSDEGQDDPMELDWSVCLPSVLQQVISLCLKGRFSGALRQVHQSVNLHKIAPMIFSSLAKNGPDDATPASLDLLMGSLSEGYFARSLFHYFCYRKRDTDSLKLLGQLYGGTHLRPFLPSSSALGPANGLGISLPLEIMVVIMEHVDYMTMIMSVQFLSKTFYSLYSFSSLLDKDRMLRDHLASDLAENARPARIPWALSDPVENAMIILAVRECTNIAMTGEAFSQSSENVVGTAMSRLWAIDSKTLAIITEAMPKKTTLAQALKACDTAPSEPKLSDRFLYKLSHAKESECSASSYSTFMEIWRISGKQAFKSLDDAIAPYSLKFIKNLVTWLDSQNRQEACTLVEEIYLSLSQSCLLCVLSRSETRPPPWAIDTLIASPGFPAPLTPIVRFFRAVPDLGLDHVEKVLRHMLAYTVAPYSLDSLRPAFIMHRRQDSYHFAFIPTCLLHSLKKEFAQLTGFLADIFGELVSSFPQDLQWFLVWLFEAQHVKCSEEELGRLLEIFGRMELVKKNEYIRAIKYHLCGN